MDDFEQEVTLKLRRRMRTVIKKNEDDKQVVTMEPCESVELWRPKKRKPSAILVNHEGRAGVLRDLANWIEVEDDPTLEKLEEKMAHERG